MTETTQDPTTMTAAQLKELLAKTEKEERAAKSKKQKAYEQDKDSFVRASVAQFADLHHQLTVFKQGLLERGNVLHKMMYEVYDKEEKDLKSFSLESADGKYKLTLDKQDRQSFDETAEVGIASIKEILHEKFASRNKTMYNIINEILSSNKAGDYDPRLVSKLSKYEEDINDPKFSEALEILRNAYKVDETALYARAYKREDANKAWSDVTLQFSKL